LSAIHDEIEALWERRKASGRLSEDQAVFDELQARVQAKIAARRTKLRAVK
jgi:hypothetical protein